MTDQMKYVHPTEKVELMFSGGHPWRRDADLFRQFCEWLGNQNPNAIKAGMSPRRAGLGYVINCEKTHNDLEKLDAAWEEFQELQRRKQQKVEGELESVDQPVPPKLISEMTPEDQQVAMEAMERAKKNLRRN